MSVEKCAVKRCRQTEIELSYCGKPVCTKHWKNIVTTKTRLISEMNFSGKGETGETQKNNKEPNESE